MSLVLTDDFGTEVYLILEPYSGRDLALMISGGSLLQCLDDERYGLLDTSGWSVFYSDERGDKSHLNYTASIPFLSRTQASVHRIDVSMPLDQAARAYSSELVDIDLCLLGIGGDGHICSLLPGCKELMSDEYVVALEGDFPVSCRRISITPRFINERVARLYFVVPGSKKKGVAAPDRTILERINKEFTVLLEK